MITMAAAANKQDFSVEKKRVTAHTEDALWFAVVLSDVGTVQKLLPVQELQGG